MFYKESQKIYPEQTLHRIKYPYNECKFCKLLRRNRCWCRIGDFTIGKTTLPAYSSCLHHIIFCSEFNKAGRVVDPKLGEQVFPMAVHGMEADI